VVSKKKGGVYFMVERAVDESVWELDRGLVDDVDAYISNCWFGISREEYLSQVRMTDEETRPLQIVFELSDPDTREVIAQVGCSCGKGWETDDDGKEISHPTRKNVVESSVYGQLQKRAFEAGAEMYKYGPPTRADTWVGLAFHWNLEEHATVGARKDGSRVAASLMPTKFLGVIDVEEEEEEKPVKPKSKAKSKNQDLRQQLIDMAGSYKTAKAFTAAAIAVDGVTDDKSLLDEVVNGSLWEEAKNS